MNPSDMSLKNTKAEILDALNAALEREAAAKRMKSDPVQEEKKKNEKAVVESSRTAVGLNIFSDELVKKFRDLETAIQVEEGKLAELYGVEQELQNLTLVINAGKDALQAIEDEKNAKTEESQSAIQQLRDSYSKKSEDLKTEYENRAKALKMEREREAEEFEYNLKRNRAIEENKWNDEKIRRETELAEKEQKASSILEDAQNRAAYLAELEEKVAGIPAAIEAEKAAAVKAAGEELNRDFEHRTAILEKDYANTISRLEYQVESLTKELDKSNALANELQAKLDKAYSEMRELATKTVETSGGVRFIANTATGEK